MLCSHRTRSEVFAKRDYMYANLRYSHLSRKNRVRLFRESLSMLRCHWRFWRNGGQQYCSCLWASSAIRHYFVFVYSSRLGHGWRRKNGCLLAIHANKHKWTQSENSLHLRTGVNTALQFNTASSALLTATSLSLLSILSIWTRTHHHHHHDCNMPESSLFLSKI